MKYGIMILILTLSWGFGQCDANGDGELDVLDVVVEVNCILTDCWGGEFVCEDCGDSECCDCDGNVYETIQIGTQTWMAENLKVTHYNDGSEIQYVQSESSEPDVWENLSTGAYGYYNDDPSHLDTYGNHYNWYVVDDDRGVCPEGWHVPSYEQYTILTDYLGGTVAGGKMKSTGTIESDDGLWYSPNEGATNESGFTGLPAGYRAINSGTDIYMGDSGYFWSSSEYSSYVLALRLFSDNSSVSGIDYGKHAGFSIRCLRD